MDWMQSYKYPVYQKLEFGPFEISDIGQDWSKMVAARFRTAEIQDVAVFFTQERKRHTLVFLNELMCEAFRTYKNKGHWLVPQPTETSP